MQNLIVFCHSCFSWVEPVSDMCPECGFEVNLDRPDPDRESLATTIGQQTGVLGPVRIERRNLPSYGHLIATSEGILFLPRLHRRINGAWEAVTSQRVPKWWPLRGEQSSLGFLNWLRLPFANVAHDETLPVAVPERETESLVDRLMESPGAFFIARRSIRSITARRRAIKIERMPLRSITLVDDTEEGLLVTSLKSPEE